LRREVEAAGFKFVGIADPGRGAFRSCSDTISWIAHGP